MYILLCAVSTVVLFFLSLHIIHTYLYSIVYNDNINKDTTYLRLIVVYNIVYNDVIYYTQCGISTIVTVTVLAASAPYMMDVYRL